MKLSERKAFFSWKDFYEFLRWKIKKTCLADRFRGACLSFVSDTEILRKALRRKQPRDEKFSSLSFIRNQMEGIFLSFITHMSPLKGETNFDGIFKYNLM